MHATEVHGELLVDEDPYVIVSREVESFSTFVLKPVPNHTGEPEVEVGLRVPPAQAIEQEEASGPSIRVGYPFDGGVPNELP